MIRSGQSIRDFQGFDSLKGESFYGDKMDKIEEILENAGVVKESQGAKIVDLESKGLGVCMIRKSDGSTIYATRDLAAIKYRAETYNFDKCLYENSYKHLYKYNTLSDKTILAAVQFVTGSMQQSI